MRIKSYSVPSDTDATEHKHCHLEQSVLLRQLWENNLLSWEKQESHRKNCYWNQEYSVCFKNSLQNYIAFKTSLLLYPKHRSFRYQSIMVPILRGFTYKVELKCFHFPLIQKELMRELVGKYLFLMFLYLI